MSQPSNNPLPENKAQSVSFGDLENQERSRRFTISAQPSTVNLTNAEKAVPLPPSRKSSLSNNKSNSEMFQYFANISTNPNRQINHGYFSSGNSSRVASPTLEEPGHFNKVYSVESIKDNRKIKVNSPPPPDLKAAQPINITKKPSISRKGSQKKSNKTVVASPVGPPVPFQEYLSKEDDGKIHILLACTGSVATIKVPLIIDKLIQIYGKSKISIQLVVTRAAGHFLKGLKIHNDVKIWRDEDEWANYECFEDKDTGAMHLSVSKKPKNPFDKMILHNELRRWADIMLIAPLSANTMAKIVNGISDSLLTSIVRSWGPSTSQGMKKPIIVAPAMNTFMYTHPVTSKQINILSSPENGFGIEVLKPVEKVLVCGDIGMGGMREWTELVDILRRRINTITENIVPDGDIEEEEEDENNDEKEDGDDEEEDDDDEEEDDDDEEDDDEDEDEEEEDEKLHTNVGRLNFVDKNGGETKAMNNEDRTFQNPSNIGQNDVRGTNNVKNANKEQGENDNDGMIFDITDNE